MNCNCQKRDGKNCIESVPIFSNLSHEEMMEIAEITSERTYAKGEMIYAYGDKREKLYVIHSGKIKITRLSDSGKEQVIRVLGPGDFMGELSLFNSGIHTDNGEVLEKTTLCVIHGELIRKLMTKYPTIAFKVMEELSKRLEKAESLIENISIHGVEKRLVDTLIGMANEKGEITLNMSKKDLSSHIGMSQETLSRKLSSFQNMGFIKLIGHRRIVILDMLGLEKIK